MGQNGYRCVARDRSVSDGELNEAKQRLLALRGEDFERNVRGKSREKMQKTGELYDLTGTSYKARAHLMESYETAIQTAEQEDQVRAHIDEKQRTEEAARQRQAEIKKITLDHGQNIVARISENRTAARLRYTAANCEELRVRQVLQSGVPETIQVQALETFVDAKLGAGSFRPMLQKHCAAAGIEGEPDLAQMKAAIAAQFIDVITLPHF